MGIFEWFKNRAIDRRKAEFERGYGWAMTLHFHEGYGIEAIYDLFYNTTNYSAFDEGAHAALQRLINLPAFIRSAP